MDTVICYNRVNATVVELVDTRDSKQNDCHTTLVNTTLLENIITNIGQTF